MAQHTIEVSQNFSKPVEEIYAWLSNHNNLGKLFMAPVKRIQDGADEINGVGSIRRIGPWPVGVQETVTAAEPNRSIDYRITRFGGPVRNHRGHLDFKTTTKGSRVEWTIEFDSYPVIGTVLETVLSTVVSRGLKRNA